MNSLKKCFVLMSVSLALVVANASEEAGVVNKQVAASNSAAAVMPAATTAVAVPSVESVSKTSDLASTVQNNTIQILPAQPVVAAPPTAIAYGATPPTGAPAASATSSDGATLSASAQSSQQSSHRMAIMPLIGGTQYSGRWGNHIGNQFSTGIVLDIPVNSFLNIEAEGGYGRFNISYGGPGGNPYMSYNHWFNQYSIGGNLKGYLLRGPIQPYLGIGILGVYYENMTRGPSLPLPYNYFLGATQVMTGADIALSDSISIGPRVSWVVPTFSRPGTMSDGYQSYPNFEEAGAMNTSFFRFMGAVKVNL